MSTDPTALPLAARDRPEVVERALKLQDGSVLAREVLRLREVIAHGFRDNQELRTEVAQLRDRDRTVAAVTRFVLAALENEPRVCKFHGGDFGRAGMRGGEPECGACRHPWRVVRALQALDALAGPREGVGAAR
jgi:hypothetical protein